MTRIVVTLLVLLAPIRAFAGWECPDNHKESIKSIEAYAKDAKHAPEPDFLCADSVAKEFPDRVAKACQKILDRKDSMTDECVDLSAFAGLSKVGDHDILSIVSARKENPFDFPGGFWWERLTFLGAMNDARAVPLIIDAWKAASPKAAKKKSDNAVTSWVMWRRDACTALATIGGADEIAFLQQEVATAKQKLVKNTCNDAIASIKKRLGQP
jgi:hypothetical protein